MHKIKLLIAIPAVLGYLYLTTIFYNQYIADYLLKKADIALVNRDNLAAVNYSTQAITRNPHEPAYYRWRAKAFIAISVTPREPRSGMYKNLALADLEKAYQLNPKNLATLRNSAMFYYFLAVKDLSRPASAQNTDPKFLPAANAYFNRLKKAAPNDVGVYVLLAPLERDLGMATESKEDFEKIRELRPDLLEWYEKLQNVNVSL
jgi:tetratricopeptide (TPR) repeat protein